MGGRQCEHLLGLQEGGLVGAGRHAHVKVAEQHLHDVVVVDVVESRCISRSGACVCPIPFFLSFIPTVTYRERGQHHDLPEAPANAGSLAQGEGRKGEVVDGDVVGAARVPALGPVAFSTMDCCSSVRMSE